MRLLATILVCICAAGPCAASPWLRETRTAFVSASALATDSGGADAAIYAEYGLRPDLTLGAKLDLELGRGDRSGYLFARRPWGARDGPLLFAYDLGVGLSDKGGVQNPFLRFGLSAGRGIVINDRGGWAVVEAAVERPTGVGHTRFKLDGTLGLSFTDQWQGMLQTFVSHENGDTTAKLAPSVLWSPDAAAVTFQLGLEADAEELALRVGIWRSF